MPVFLHSLIELTALIIIGVELGMKLRWIGWLTILKHKRTMTKVKHNFIRITCKEFILRKMKNTCLFLGYNIGGYDDRSSRSYGTTNPTFSRYESSEANFYSGHSSFGWCKAIYQTNIPVITANLRHVNFDTIFCCPVFNPWILHFLKPQ